MNNLEKKMTLSDQEIDNRIDELESQFNKKALGGTAFEALAQDAIRVSDNEPEFAHTYCKTGFYSAMDKD